MMTRAARPPYLVPALCLVLVLLGGCGGAEIGGLQGDAMRVDVAGDTFFVTRTAHHAVARNYATGLFNQDRLFANAQTAITQATGCAIADFDQETSVNTYRARLTCA